MLAPHIASASVDTRKKMSMMAVENAVAALEGQRPANLLNPEAWEGPAGSAQSGDTPVTRAPIDQ